MRLTRLLPLVSALLVLGAGAVSAQVAQAPMDLEVLRAATGGERPNVIVTYRPGARARLLRYFKKDVIRGEAPNVIAVDVKLRTVGELAANPDILAIPADAKVSGHQVAAGNAGRQDIQNLRAALGLTGSLTGTGVGIAIIDSGVAPTSDLDTSVRAFYDFTDGRQIATTRNDQYGQGTHVPGLIAAKALLQYSSIPLSDEGIDTALEQGAGSINATGAVPLAHAVNPSATTGTLWTDQAFSPFTVIAGTTHTCSQSIIWGDNIVCDTVLWNHAAWALNIVWGDVADTSATR